MQVAQIANLQESPLKHNFCVAIGMQNGIACQFAQYHLVHAGAVLILVLALDPAAAVEDKHQNETADLAFSTLFLFMNNEKVAEAAELALLRLQAVLRFCKLMESYIAFWTSHVPLNGADDVDGGLL